MAQAYITTGTVTSRAPADRSAERWDVLDFGALGTATGTTIGATYATTQTDTLAHFAAVTISGAMPFGWVTDPHYGLTFTMSTTSGQSAAGTKLTFLKTGASGINGWVANIALWQDPQNGNYLLAPGMLVSGSCIAANTTISSVDRTPGDANYGTITLSLSTSAACASNTAITFTISATQFRALTLDWLGIQSAVAAAVGPTGSSPAACPTLQSASGKAVYMPSGNYIVNHPIVNPGCIVDTYQQVPNIDFFGDGIATTRISFPSDLGTDMCGIVEATRGITTTPSTVGYTSFSRYHDFRLLGPFVSKVLGSFPNNMDGICIGQTAGIYSFRADSFHAGVNAVKDHWYIQHSTLTNNGYGVYFAPYTQTIGNSDIEESDLTGNAIASVGVSSTNAIDGATFLHVHTGFEPYGFYGEAVPNSVTTAISGFITNSEFDNVFQESIGNGWIYGPNPNDAVTGNNFVGGGFSNIDPAFTIPSTPVKAVVYANAFSENTNLGTDWSAYSGVADGIIETAGTNANCGPNTFLNDVHFITGATAAKPPMVCPNGILQNRFFTSVGDGIIMKAGATLAGSVPVYNAGNTVAQPYAPGKPFAGITATPANSGNSVAVFSYAAFINAVPLSGGTVATGQALVATTGGVTGSVDPTGAVGSAFFGSSGSTVSMSLDTSTSANIAGGVAANLTAAGTTQGTAFAVTAAVNAFSTVAAGTGAVLPSAVRPITIYNRGANALKVYPPSGSKIESNATNAAVTLAAGADATFRPITATQWLQ